MVALPGGENWSKDFARDFVANSRTLVNVINIAPQTVSAFTYAYDALHRRIRAELEDGSRWNYDYNDRNEVTAGRRSWNDWTPVAGQQFEYAFDNIGNRTTAKSGGNASGAGLRTETYTANNLNQYSSRTVPGAVESAVPGDNSQTHSCFGDRESGPVFGTTLEMARVVFRVGHRSKLMSFG